MCKKVCETTASLEDLDVNQDSNYGRGTLTAEVHTFKIDVKDQRARQRWRVTSDKAVDHTTKLCLIFDHISLDAPHHAVRKIQCH